MRGNAGSGNFVKGARRARDDFERLSDREDDEGLRSVVSEEEKE